MNPLFSLSYDVQPSELDPEYRHVDHTRSLKLLERCRLAFLEELGYPNSAFIQQQLFAVVTSVRAYYRREVLQETVTVTCERYELFDRTFTMFQRILNGRGKLAIDAEVDWLFMDGRTKRAIDPPADFLATIAAYAANRLKV